MVQLVFIGICAGAAAALMFASVASGTLLSVPLFYVAPLPIMIAGIGWSHWVALIATLTAALSLSVTFSAASSIAFLGVGVPAWWLSYLTMLARPAAINAGAGGPAQGPNAHTGLSLEWYPPGQLVLWTALLAASVVVAAVLSFGFDAESFRASLRQELAQLLQIDGDKGANLSLLGNPANLQRLLNILVEVAPPASAVIMTLANLFNLWLAAHIVKFSVRLARPWPTLSAMTLPKLLSLILAMAVALSFVEGLIGIVANVFSASLLIAYSMLGLAVVHDITLGMQSRALVLCGVYVCVVYAIVALVVWPILALCLLGVAETIMDLRIRVNAKRGWQ